MYTTGMLMTEIRRPDYQRAKMEARRILSNFGLAEPPIDPVTIARGIGVNVTFVEFEPLHDNISGFYDAEEDAIYVNKMEFPLRQTFTVAHELGHKILHEDWARSSEYKMLLRDAASDSKDPFEQEANSFAANLLVPREMLNNYWQTLSLDQLSQLFAVSVPVIKNRISFEYGA